MILPDRFAYLHGFASGPTSKKGQLLAAAFASHGATLHLPDLNVPSFAELTCSGMLTAVDALDREHGGADNGGRWGFVGSSMGGWVAARWAELHPERIARLVLLAPAFDLPNRWEQLISRDELATWERRGWCEVADAAGVPTRLRWNLMADARRQPPFPQPRCPTLVLHGGADEVVPLAMSERYVRTYPQIELETLDDNHDLLATLPRIEQRCREWLGVTAPVPEPRPTPG